MEWEWKNIEIEIVGEKTGWQDGSCSGDTVNSRGRGIFSTGRDDSRGSKIPRRTFAFSRRVGRVELAEFGVKRRGIEVKGKRKPADSLTCVRKQRMIVGVVVEFGPHAQGELLGVRQLRLVVQVLRKESRY